MKKAVSILMSVVLLLTLLSAFGTATASAASGTMYVGSSKYVYVSAGSYVEYYFTPTYSGSYTFYSTGSYDTYGYIMSYSGTALSYDDDSGDSLNFSVTYTLTANTTYILRSKFYNSSLSGYFYQYIRSNHTHTYSGNCDTTCDSCGATRTTSYSHTYTNACDTSCNVCSATRTITHTYTNVCDTTCDVCGAIRTVTHTYSNSCDSHCNYCDYVRDASHTYTNAADSVCDVCGTGRRLNYIQEDESMLASISNGGQYVDFVFRPEVTDRYYFFSQGNSDTVGYILDYYGEQLHYDDDNGAGQNFGISCQLTEGITYILRAKFYSSSVTGTFNVEIGKIHYYSYECDDTCDNCGYVRTPEEEHSYTNSCDTTCDYCGHTRSNPPHYYSYGCDDTCNYCGYQRANVTHTFDDDNDCYCNECCYYCFELIDPPASEVYAVMGDLVSVPLKVRSGNGSYCSYQWYVKNEGASEFSASSITTSTYSAKMSDKVVGRQVYCSIYDYWSGETIQTDVITLRPTFTLNEGSQLVYAQNGKIAKVALKASGEGLTYTWYFKNAGASKYSKSSVTSSTYSVKMSSASKGRRVLCIVKDKYGNSLQSQSYLIRESVSLTSQPSSTTQTVKQGSTVKLAIKARGDGLSYTWYIKNSGASKYSKSSVTSSTYSVKMTDAVSGRRVYCVVKDKYGKTVQSKTYLLQSDFAITTQPKTTYVNLGSTAKATVKAKGTGLTYAWYVKNVGATKFTKSSNTTATYSVKMTAAVHGRQVYCVVKDSKGNSVTSSTVYLRCKAAITTQPKNAMVANGKVAKVSIKAVGDGLTYTWYIKDSGKSTYTKSSNTTATYSVKMSGKANGRLVYCVVKDKYGNTVQTKTAILMMK